MPGKAGTMSNLRRRRPSTTEAIFTTLQTLEKKAESKLLLLWDDLPPWRRDNAFIRSGYRQIRASYAHSFQSLCS